MIIKSDIPTEWVMKAAAKKAKPGWYIQRSETPDPTEFEQVGRVCGACLLGTTALMVGLNLRIFAGMRRSDRKEAEHRLALLIKSDMSNLDDLPGDVSLRRSTEVLDKEIVDDLISVISKRHPTVKSLRARLVELYGNMAVKPYHRVKPVY